MNERLDAKLIYNSISHQDLTYANQLTVQTWNNIINQLSMQANELTKYVNRLSSWLHDSDGGGTGYLDEISQNLNALARTTSNLAQDIQSIKESQIGGITYEVCEVTDDE